MTARPIAVGDRVRMRANHIEDQRAGVVVRIGDQTPHPSYGEPYSVGVYLDDDGHYLGGVLGCRLSELERIDDTPHTSSAPLTEDPADTLATPCATSATPEPVDPATGPAPEAGAASAHDAAPALRPSAPKPAPAAALSGHYREAVRRGDALAGLREVVTNHHLIAPVEPLRDDLDNRPQGVEFSADPQKRPFITERGQRTVMGLEMGFDVGHDRREVTCNTHEISPWGRAEASEPSQLVTDTVGDGSDVGASLPTVGGRAVPPVPAPADTSTEPLVYGVTDEALVETTGATSVHDAAPVTDLAALRDAAYRLRDLRAEIDALLDVEQTLAARVSEGLGTLVGVPVDLNWGTDRPDALADGAR